MANTKKTENENNVKQDEVVENITEVVDNNVSEVEKLKKDNEELLKKFVELQQMFAQMQFAQSNVAPQPVEKNSLMEEIKLIHLAQRAPGLATHIELSNMTIDMNAFLEERTLDRRQAEEIAGKYRTWFDKGIITFGDGCEDIAKRFALKSLKDYNIQKDLMERIGRMSVKDLEETYNRLPKAMKASIIETFKRKIMQGDPAFKDSQKIEMLNRISRGAMSGTTLDMNRDEQKNK